MSNKQFTILNFLFCHELHELSQDYFFHFEPTERSVRNLEKCRFLNQCFASHFEMTPCHAELVSASDLDN